MTPTLEDQLRATMRAHDDDLTDQALSFRMPSTQPATPRTHTQRWVWLAAAIVVLAVGSLAVAQRPPHRAPPQSALACPTTAPKAPPKPVAVSSADRLVPAELIPVRAVVCGYLWDGTKSARVVTTDLAAMVAYLSWVPSWVGVSGGCDLVARASDNNQFLIGLQYAHGSLWVSAPGQHCAGSTNGTFASFANLSGVADAMIAQGRWVAPTVDTCGGTGRLGGERALVPPGAVRANICVPSTTGWEPVASLPGNAVADLANALNGLPPIPRIWGCHGNGTQQTYQVSVRYAQGPPVGIVVAGYCNPAWAIGSQRQAAVNATLYQLITTLIRQYG